MGLGDEDLLQPCPLTERVPYSFGATCMIKDEFANGSGLKEHSEIDAVVGPFQFQAPIGKTGG